MKVPTRDWEERFDKRVNELRNADEQKEIPVKFGYRRYHEEWGYPVEDEVVNWENVKSFIRSLLKEERKRVIGELIEKIDSYEEWHGGCMDCNVSGLVRDEVIKVSNET